jgi:hypothetical protein
MNGYREEEILRAALELVFEDDPTPRTEGNEEEGSGVKLARRQ